MQSWYYLPFERLFASDQVLFQIQKFSVNRFPGCHDNIAQTYPLYTTDGV